MDAEVSLLVHCATWGGLLQSQVQVEVSESFNRQTDETLERHIEEIWAERASKEPWLFNGAKFRLHSFHMASPSCYSSPSSHELILGPAECVGGRSDCKQTGDERFCTSDCQQDSSPNSVILRNTPENLTENVDDVLQKTEGKLSHHSSKSYEDRPLLTLRVGLTCYKAYLGTNWSCRVDELRKRGEMEFSDPMALLAQPLGVGAIMCTADSKVVLIRRSQTVAEASGQLDIPGGHPEPKVMCERLGQTVCEEQISVELLQQKPEAIVSELFSSICAEIRDEVNVPLNVLAEPVLMGVALNHTSAGRPSAEFYVSCSLTSEEVRELYWKGGAEADESTDIVFISTTEVLELGIGSPLWVDLCPSAKGAVLLFQKVKRRMEPEQTIRCSAGHINS